MIVVTSLTLMWVLLDHMRACPPTDVLALVAYEIIVIGAVLMNIIAVAAGAIDSVNLGFAVSEVCVVVTHCTVLQRVVLRCTVVEYVATWSGALQRGDV